eukprot:2466393-Rhodomonas_salina.2
MSLRSARAEAGAGAEQEQKQEGDEEGRRSGISAAVSGSEACGTIVEVGAYDTNWRTQYNIIIPFLLNSTKQQILVQIRNKKFKFAETLGTCYEQNCRRIASGTRSCAVESVLARGSSVPGYPGTRVRNARKSSSQNGHLQSNWCGYNNSPCAPTAGAYMLYGES